MTTDLWLDRIVVGMDGSEPARQAAVWAAREAMARGRGLTLVHSVLPPSAGSAFGPGFPIGLDVMDDVQAAVRDELESFARTLPSTDVLTQVEIGSPSGVLLAASETAALIVLGSRGHGGFRGLLLGSVSIQVTAHAECPVVVIRDLPPGDAHRIVVGIDGSPASESAIAFAFDMASRHNWTVTALHAWEVPAYDLLVIPDGPIPVPLADVVDDEVRLAAEVLAGFQADYPDVTVEERLVRQNPVDAILEAAEGAAMIAVGSRGHGQVVGALLGSVSHGVLHKARVPVVVVPFVPSEDDAA